MSNFPYNNTGMHTILQKLLIILFNNYKYYTKEISPANYCYTLKKIGNHIENFSQYCQI